MAHFLIKQFPFPVSLSESFIKSDQFKITKMHSTFVCSMMEEEILYLETVRPSKMVFVCLSSFRNGAFEGQRRQESDARSKRVSLGTGKHRTLQSSGRGKRVLNFAVALVKRSGFLPACFPLQRSEFECP